LKGTSQREWVLSQETFDELLAWLHTDREQAGKIYEEIRNRLIKIFMYRSSAVAEELADETINRVARKVHEIRGTYVGNPSLYFHGVARYVYLEHVKKMPDSLPHVLVSPPIEPDESELEHRCLEQCMQHLTPHNRELVLEYFQEDKRAKIERRKELTQRFGITLNALRIRAHRICAHLKKCLHECLETAQT
jgi:DNA-directed RNA polymerase specialized sigma24 family protein